MDAELRDAVLNDEGLLLRQQYRRAASGEFVCLQCAFDKWMNGFMKNRLIMQAAKDGKGKRVVSVGDIFE